MKTLLGLRATYRLYSNVPFLGNQLASLPQPGARSGSGRGQDSLGPAAMMDSDLRLRRVRQEAADQEVGLILLDVVLGRGFASRPGQRKPLAVKRRSRRTRPGWKS
ncbi:MAG: hypothetical protein M9927_07735 [Anaerolineae bacterium]|nr:hypothetical protein [Anaerolineae bacterium]